MVRSHFGHLRGRAVRAVVLGAECEGARGDHQVQPEYAEHAEQPAGRRSCSLAVAGRDIQGDCLPEMVRF